MKSCELMIGRAAWDVRFFFDVHARDAGSVVASLIAAGCPARLLRRIRANLLRDALDTGFTYSNDGHRRSVVVVGRASSQGEFLNSLEHELRHLCDDIAAASGWEMRGEDVAYLAGDLNLWLWRDVHEYICCGCRGVSRGA